VGVFVLLVVLLRERENIFVLVAFRGQMDAAAAATALSHTLQRREAPFGSKTFTQGEYLGLHFSSFLCTRENCKSWRIAAKRELGPVCIAGFYRTEKDHILLYDDNRF
jgi:hypothetical protein